MSLFNSIGQPPNSNRPPVASSLESSFSLPDGRVCKITIQGAGQSEITKHLKHEILTIMKELNCFDKNMQLHINLNSGLTHIKIASQKNLCEQQLSKTITTSQLFHIKPVKQEVDIAIFPTSPPPTLPISPPTESPPLIAFGQLLYEERPMSPAAQAHIASLAEKYGHKTANLLFLEELCKDLRKKGIPTSVPPFLGLDSDTIKAHIHSHYPHFERDWQRFIAHQADQPLLTSEAIEQLTLMQENIKNLFCSHPLASEQCAQFLQSTHGNCMVRSSGREDTEDLANAGGNESVAGVAPTLQQISAAIGTVVASYFSTQSMSQRLLANDNITQQHPLLAVLVQQMIGEEPTGTNDPLSIPISGVMYTQEMAGETKDLTKIENTYGHNEAVVNSKLPTEEHYLYGDDSLPHSVIVPKYTRLVAQQAQEGQAQFISVANPPELVFQPALSATQLKQLKEVSKAVHEAYGKPMDIEWVYLNGTIYLVQARPLVSKQQATPSICDFKALPVQSEQRQGTAIVAPKGACQVISSPSEIVSYPRLAKAFNDYLDEVKKQKSARGSAALKEESHGVAEAKVKIKAVIIAEKASALSHPACVLRENGILLFASDQPIDTKKLQEGYLVVDPQQGKMAFVPDSTLAGKTSEEIEAHLFQCGLLKKGWFFHPIAAAETLQQIFFTSEEQVKTLYDKLLKDYPLEERHAQWEELRQQGNFLLPHILSQLSSNDFATSQAAFKDVLYLLYASVKQLGEEGQDPLLFERGKQLLQRAACIASEGMDRQERMQQLHAAKRLEALLYQHSSGRIVNGDSLQKLLSAKKIIASSPALPIALTAPEQLTLNALENSVTKQASVETKAKMTRRLTTEEASRYYQALLSIGNLAFRPEIGQSWALFASKIAASRSPIATQKLLQMVGELKKLGITQEWLNSYFVENARSESDSIALLQKMAIELQRVAPSAQKIQKWQENIHSWQIRWSEWEEPTKFEALWHDFQREMALPLLELSREYAQLQQGSALAKMLLYRSILDGVALYDSSIKAMRSSPIYQQKQMANTQAAYFRSMLAPYMLLQTLWLEALPTTTLEQWTKNMVGSDFSSADLYRQYIITELKNLFDKIPADDPEQLFPDSSFNTQGACIHSGQYFPRVIESCQPTLENLFSLAHQNILACLETMRAGLSEESLPEQLQLAMGMIRTIQGEIVYGHDTLHISPMLTSLNAAPPIITAGFNAPIKLHGAGLKLTYDCHKQSCECAFDIYGHNMGGRMDDIVICLTILSGCHDLLLIALPQYDPKQEQLTVAWKFDMSKKEPISEQLATCAHFIYQAIESTIGGSFGVGMRVDYQKLQREGRLKRLNAYPQLLKHLKEKSHYALPKLFTIFCEERENQQVLDLLSHFGGEYHHQLGVQDLHFKQKLLELMLQDIGENKRTCRLKYKFDNMGLYSTSYEDFLFEAILAMGKQEDLGAHFVKLCLQHPLWLIPQHDLPFLKQGGYLALTSKLGEQLLDDGQIEQLAQLTDIFGQQAAWSNLAELYNTLSEKICSLNGKLEWNEKEINRAASSLEELKRKSSSPLLAADYESDTEEAYFSGDEKEEPFQQIATAETKLQKLQKDRAEVIAQIEPLKRMQTALFKDLKSHPSPGLFVPQELAMSAKAASSMEQIEVGSLVIIKRDLDYYFAEVVSKQPKLMLIFSLGKPIKAKLSSCLLLPQNTP